MALDDMALSVRDLEITLVGGGRSVPVVTGVSLTAARGEIVGLVGESGSGKSLTSLAITRLLDPRVATVTAGSVGMYGRELLDLPEPAMRAVRGKEIGMIFQDPMSSLDPAFTTGYQLTSVLRRHTSLGRRAARDRAVELLGLVGIADPRRRVDQYPHQLSGGMRQRVMIAMAIACEPKVLIADEPTTALDATTQAQILELVAVLAGTLRMATIITTHDLGVVAEVCDRVAVMYAGQVVERAGTEQLFYRPRHPYTERLLQSLPRVGAAHRLTGIPGQPPRAGDFPAGCRFAARCGYATESRCTTADPVLRQLADDRSARCVRTDELELIGVDA
ncbi:ABC transporter ATP-binding protein [Streptomyces sp. NPDC001642]|uniref:ABC transporter ATP-binding protein n=1 Tax=Streptomyces sp. NPDC001642 TaxID=3154392 RepID=UPI003323A926